MKKGAKLQKKVLPPTLFVICIFSTVILSFIWPIDIIMFPYNLVGVIFLFVGLMISRNGSNKFEKVGTNINTFDEPDILVTDGLFKYSRNPMYLGFVIALFGVSIILGTVSSFIILIIFILITDQWYIKFEERVMMEKFGEKYMNYMKITRRWI